MDDRRRWGGHRRRFGVFGKARRVGPVGDGGDGVGGGGLFIHGGGCVGAHGWDRVELKRGGYRESERVVVRGWLKVCVCVAGEAFRLSI